MKISDLREAQFRLIHQRVLLILDDVCSKELQTLGNIIQCLRFGSKVIVTNRNLSTLRNNRIQQIYKVAFPSKQEALQIFSYSAFGQSSPPRAYLEHAVKVAKLIAPYPLGLKVLGSSLRGKRKDVWTTTVPKLRTCLVDKGNMEELIRFFYDGLSRKQKNLLYRLTNYVRLGESLNNAIFFLGESDWDVEKGIQTLADLALISISREGGINMHCLVQYIVIRDPLVNGHKMAKY